MLDWIYTKDRQPEKSRQYLTVDGYGIMAVSDFWEDGMIWCDWRREEFEPIAWMKIPRFVRI